MHDDIFTKRRRGEFRGDFTRDTFDPRRHFSRVLMQQGRVQLDADWNEQVSIFVRYFRKLGADLMGPHGAPCAADGEDGEGFKITKNGETFNIAGGHYYVNGILCENDAKELTYFSQPDLPLADPELKTLDAGIYLVYLDVWERHLSYVEDDYMREKALGGADTATRARIVWQVKHIKLNENDTNKNYKDNYEQDFLTKIAEEKKPGSGSLKARARKKPEVTTDPCLTFPEAKYRGTENQLYRVEIHKDGGVQSNDQANGSPTFKWSRENGSVIFPIKKIEKKKITLEHLGRDNRYGLKPNDWVEILDDDYILRNEAFSLLQVLEVDNENIQVKLSGEPENTIGKDKNKHPYMRRWDQKSGGTEGIPLMEGNGENGWIPLENGIEIQFSTDASPGKNYHVYHTGDYWLIPARTATGDVEWPGPVDAPHALPPHGVEHHYAPLAKINVDNGKISVENDLRRKLKKNWD